MTPVFVRVPKTTVALKFRDGTIFLVTEAVAVLTILDKLGTLKTLNVDEKATLPLPDLAMRLNVAIFGPQRGAKLLQHVLLSRSVAILPNLAHHRVIDVIATRDAKTAILSVSVKRNRTSQGNH